MPLEQFEREQLRTPAAQYIAELEAALRIMAVGRKPCASGTQRLSRDEMKEVARQLCVKLGISWK